MPKPNLHQCRRHSALCLALTLLLVLFATTASASPVPETSEPPHVARGERLPGVEIASEFTKITGIAASPLLGVSAWGAWSYLRASQARRATLPWFCHPAIWGIGLLVVVLAKFKDLAGTGLPPLVKKPLDMAELFEDKISALVATGAIVPTTVPHLANQFTAMQSTQESLPFALNQASVLPFDLPSVVLMAALVPVVLFVFGVVWLMSHAIDVLVALSPFGFLDILLKSLKGLLLLALTVPFFIHPLLGSAITLLIIVVAAWVAPGAFRFMVFGTLMSLDVLWPWGKQVESTNAHAFTARRIKEVPVRTYGRLSSASGGRLEFSYRPWLVLPRRTLTLEHSELCLGRGLLFPSLMQRTSSNTWQRLFVFLPRYRAHDTALCNALALAHIHDSHLSRGFRLIRTWFSEVFGRSRVLPATEQERTSTEPRCM